MARGSSSLPIDLDSKRKGIRTSVLNFFQWEEGDAEPAIRAAIFLFLVIAAFVVLKTTRDTTFLSTYHARELPKYMTVNTLISALLAFFLLRLFRVVSLRRILQVTLVIFSVVPIFIWKHLPEHLQIAPTTFYVLVGVYGTMVPVQAWSLVVSRLSTRQAKRTLSFIGSGAILGGIVGGFLSRFFVNHWGVQSLIPAISLLILSAFVSCPASPGKGAEVPPPKIKETEERQNLKLRYALLILSIVAMGTIVSTFLDFQFKAYTQREYDGEKMIGTFLGTFYGVLGIASLIFQLLITPFLLKRIGITAGLCGMPFLMFLGSTFFYFQKTFAAIVSLRGSEELTKNSLDRSSFEIVLMALPIYQQIRLKSLVETVGNRTSELIGCLVLIALFTKGNLPLTTLTLTNVIMTFVWFLCALWLGMREYPLLLREQLRREEFDLTVVRENLFTNDFYRILPALLRNADKDTILNILEILEISRYNWLGKFLTSLDHSDPEVRLRTLQLLFLQKGDMRSKVKRLLTDKDPRVRAEAVHYVSTRSRSAKEWEKFRNDENLAVRAAACAPGFQSDSKEDTEALETILKTAEKEGNQDALQEITHILQFAPPNELSISMYRRLLSNPSTSVRKFALKSIGYTKPPMLIPILLKLTRVPALKDDVRATLTQYGKHLIPYLEEIILNPGESLPRRKLALKIASDTGGIQILDSVLKAAQDPNTSLRFSAFKTLNYFRKKGILSPDHPALLPIIDRELTLLESELNCVSWLAANEDQLIATLLKQRVLWSFERVFRALALVFPHDELYHAYVGWTVGDSRKQGAAIEFLEHTLPDELRDRLLPLLEYTPADVTDEERPPLREKAFRSFLEENDPLLLSAAILEMNENEFERFLPDLRKRLKENPISLIEETIQRRSNMSNDENKPLTMIEKMESLSKVDLFSRLSPSELLLLGEVAVEAEYEEEETIYSEGQPALEIFSLIEGRVDLFRNSELISTVEPGQSFGTLGVLSSQNRFSTAIVKQKAKCLKIASETFWEILEDYTPVCHGVIEVLVQQIDSLTARLAGTENAIPKSP